MPTSVNALQLLEEIKELREFVSQIEPCENGGENQKSIANLRHYLKLRQKDNIELQEGLSRVGLSSLGRSQPHILHSLDLIVEVLSRLNNLEFLACDGAISIDEAEEIMAERAAIFGGEAKPKKRSHTKIMLTLPSEAAIDVSMIEEFASAGVGAFRINTAHDSKEEWSIMAAKIEELNKNLHPQNKLKIYVDLAGPKIRTAKIKKVKAKLKLEAGSKVYLTKKSDEEGFIKIPMGSHNLEVDEEFYKRAKKAEELLIETEDDKHRTLTVESVEKGFVVCSLAKKAKINEETKIYIGGSKRKEYFSNVLNLPDVTEEIKLFDDDTLFLALEEIEGHEKITNEAGELISPAAISCTQKEFIADAKEGDKVYIDDGKIGLIVEQKRENGLLCRVVNVKPSGETLKEEKGINFPDSKTIVDAITKEDIKNFETIVDFADIIGVSFAQREDDIEKLSALLREKNKGHIAIVAKIETKTAVCNLPQILEALIRHGKGAVMLARGDLAIEVEFENMSFLQEEILDLCEAAHIPVIFATQVLENQMKNNLPSRAEITDAAFAQRADCVMLNKGAFALNTIKKLEFILARMHTIFKKNRLLLGSCDIWKD